MQTSQFFAISAMDVEHIDTYTPGTVVNFKRSELLWEMVFHVGRS